MKISSLLSSNIKTKEKFLKEVNNRMGQAKDSLQKFIMTISHFSILSKLTWIMAYYFRRSRNFRGGNCYTWKSVTSPVTVLLADHFVNFVTFVKFVNFVIFIVDHLYCFIIIFIYIIIYLIFML